MYDKNKYILENTFLLFSSVRVGNLLYIAN